MKSKSPSGHTGMSGKSMNMHKGMKRHAPMGVDASMKPMGGSVDNNATRSGVAPTPRTLGPRDA